MVQASKQTVESLGIGPVKKFGRYTLIKKLATGGMAEIWLARQTGLAGFNRFVVIKKILSHLAEEDTFVKMFLDEARMSVQLTHPNIVQVYDLGEADKTYFIAMEYIAGENLAAIAWRGVKRKKPLSPIFAARVIADGCRALHYAHHINGPDGVPLELVHRDISPQNILVTYEGEVKVVDFGIAKAATKSQHTKTGMLKGKFSYMSPEQCLGNPLDMRSDIFALGIVLYELCTGKRLFKHESELMILEMITKRRITPPSQVADNIPPELEAIIMKALEKEVGDRFQTAQDFAIALEDFLRSQAEVSASSEIASYMRTLFKDKIDEKQQICELASKDDFLASFEDDEPTEQALPRGPTQRGRRVVYGNAGQSVPGMPAPPGMHPQMSGYRPGMPITQTGQGMMGPYGATGPIPFQGMSGSIGVRPLEEEKSWAPHIVLAFALVVIGLAGAFLWRLLNTDTEISEAAMVQNAPVRTGKIKIESKPAGATVHVNGEAIKLTDGQPARTPIEALTQLQYGKKYVIRLVKEGHQPSEKEIVMSDLIDGKTLEETLEPFKGAVRFDVRGASSDRVSILLNGERKGRGNFESSFDINQTYRVDAKLEGHRCVADPLSLTPKTASKTIVNITCEEAGGSRRSSAAVASAGNSERRRSSRGSSSRGNSGNSGSTRSGGGDDPPKRSGPAGCQTFEGLFGDVTISSTPYSVVYVGAKKLGETPLAKVRLPAGCHIVKAVFPGQNNKEKMVKINVEPNKTSRYRITL